MVGKKIKFVSPLQHSRRKSPCVSSSHKCDFYFIFTSLSDFCVLFTSLSDFFFQMSAHIIWLYFCPSDVNPYYIVVFLPFRCQPIYCCISALQMSIHIVVFLPFRYQPIYCISALQMSIHIMLYFCPSDVSPYIVVFLPVRCHPIYCCISAHQMSTHILLYLCSSDTNSYYNVVVLPFRFQLIYCCISALQRTSPQKWTTIKTCAPWRESGLRSLP